MKVTTGCWIAFSLTYFIINELFDSVTGYESLFQILILAGILLRNLMTFYAMTLYTLYQTRYSAEEKYDNDNRIKTKLSILNLDAVMTHRLPLSYFQIFINQHAQFYDVYINLYCLIEVYRNKLLTLLVKANAIKAQNGEIIDLREIDDPEFVASQIMVGRSMLNLLAYINENYQTHFKEVVIDDIENIELSLLNP